MSSSRIEHYSDCGRVDPFNGRCWFDAALRLDGSVGHPAFFSPA